MYISTQITSCESVCEKKGEKIMNLNFLYSKLFKQNSFFFALKKIEVRGKY